MHSFHSNSDPDPVAAQAGFRIQNPPPSSRACPRLSGYTAKAKAAVRAALVRAVAADPAVEYIVEDRLMHPSLAPNLQASSMS